MNPIETIKSAKLEKTPLLIQAKTVDTDVKEYYQKLNDYGINNTTREKIHNSIRKIEVEKEEIGKKQAINVLIAAFAPFAIVTYKTLDQVCNDHKLVISGIQCYTRAIPDENIEELDMFVEKLKGMDHSTISTLKACKNDKFTFDSDKEAWRKFVPTNRHYDDPSPIGTEKMFKVAAPRSHFKLNKSAIQVGNEFSNPSVDKPKLSYTPKYNAPHFEPKDPIIFIPVSFMQQVFCVIVTAWDKVADDSRILSKL